MDQELKAQLDRIEAKLDRLVAQEDLKAQIARERREGKITVATLGKNEHGY